MSSKLGIYSQAAGGAVDLTSFKMTVDTTQAGSASDTIIIPFAATGTYTGVISWGDGNVSAATAGNVSHTYASGGIYQISISGSFGGLYFNNSGDKLKLSSIDQWGNNVFNTINQSFYGCSNMVGAFTDIPNLSVVTNLARRTFFGCTLFDSDLRGWDMTNITDVQFMLGNCTAFGAINGNVSNWDVSNTQVFDNLFENCTNFDGDVDSWNVSSGTAFSKMFAACTSFQSNTLASWRPTSGTNFKQMFYNATNASFTPNVNDWGITSAATNLTYMFYNMPSFNSTDLTGWDVSSVNNMVYMFHGCSSFNGDISTWDVSSVTTMSNMFKGCSSFNQSLNSWDVSSVTSMQRMFWGATIFNGNVSSWVTSNCLNFERTFASTNSFDIDISSWNVSNATNMSYMFDGAVAFDRDLGSWNVSSVTSFTSFMNGKTPSTFTAANLDAIYNGWDSRAVQTPIVITFGSAKHTAASSTARASLVGKGWTITDGGI